MEKTVVAASDPTKADNQYMTIAEVARRMRFSVDTLRRHMVAGKLKGIEWVDFLENGKLRATTDSVEAFILSRRSATQEGLKQSSRKSRG